MEGDGLISTTHRVFDTLYGIDWDDTASILRGCTPLFDVLTTERGLLPELVAAVSTNEHLADMCEGYDFMRKLVLHDDVEHGIRLRLHLYNEGFFDRPHNHRWSFASHILRGGYTHRIFGRDDQFAEETDPADLTPIHERLERPGSTYALHHTSVHSVHAEADTVSLLVRGRAAKDRFLILDAHNRSSFWVYGAANETAEQQTNKRLTPQQLNETIGRAQSLIADRPTTSGVECRD